MNWLRDRRRLVAVGTAILLFAALAWTASAFRTGANLARARELQQQMRGEAAKTLTPEQKKAIGQQFGAAMKKLSPDQKRELFKDQQRAFQKTIDQFFTLSKREQVAYLDQQINRMEEGRKKFTSGPQGKNGAPGKGGLMTVQAGQGLAKKGPKATPEERERRRKQMLDAHTPAERAKLAEYFKQLNARRQQRGLPTMQALGGRPR